MSQTRIQNHFLHAISSRRNCVIRPFSRIGCEVAFLVFTVGVTDGRRISPVFCSISVNESNDHVRIKVENDDTGIVANGGIFRNNQTTVSYSYDGTDTVLGIIDGEKITDTSEANNAHEFTVHQEMGRGHLNWYIRDTRQMSDTDPTRHMKMAVLNRTPQASAVNLSLSRPATGINRLLFMIYSVVSMFRKFTINRHPIPTNIHPGSLTSAAIPPQLAILRNVRNIILRLAFRDQQESLFMEYLDAQTHAVKLVVECTPDEDYTVLLRDICGTIHFMGKQIRNDARGYTVYRVESGNTSGGLIGYHMAQRRQYYDGTTNRSIMIDVPQDRNSFTDKICLAGQNIGAVICEHVTDPVRHTVTVGFLEDTSDENKALILANMVTMSRKKYKFNRCILPTLNNYPFQSEPSASASARCN